MKFLKRIAPFIVLNILVSVATTVLVLTLWDTTSPYPLPLGGSGGVPADPLETNYLTPLSPPLEAATPTLPPLEEPVIIIETVIGAGDLNAETVVIRRVGEGGLSITGWRMSNGRGADYFFPNLVLSKNGSVRLYSRGGIDSVIELYWGRSESSWRSGDTVSLYDYAGNLRASYGIP